DDATYVVPGVPLIPQTLNMACWYASAQMLIQWRRNKKQMTEPSLVNPSEDVPSVARWKANNGIDDSFILTLVADLGLVPVPPQSPTVQAIGSWHQGVGIGYLRGRGLPTVE